MTLHNNIFTRLWGWMFGYTLYISMSSGHTIKLKGVRNYTFTTNENAKVIKWNIVFWHNNFNTIPYVNPSEIVAVESH